MGKPIFLISTQRSGTNLFRRAISQNEMFQEFSEPFAPRSDYGFWFLKTKLIESNKDLVIPTPENQNYIFKEFLEYFSSHCTKEYYIIDIKYDSVEHFNSVWHNPCSRPNLFELIKKYNIPVIHLIRSNYLEVYISSLLASRTQVWVADASSNPTEDSPQENLIEVDLQELIQAVKNRENQVELFKSYVNSCPQCLNLFYENLLSEDGTELSKQVVQKIKKLLEFDNDFQTSVVTRKLAPSLSKLIKNYDQVAAVMRGLGYGRLLSK